MARGHGTQWVGAVGTTLTLVRAPSEDAAREKVAEMALERCRQKGLRFDPEHDVHVRRARAADVLHFAGLDEVA